MRRGYAIFLVLLVMLLFVGGVVYNVTYTKQVDERSDRRQAEQRARQDRRWCSLLATLDQQGSPPTTERGRMVQQQIHELRRELGCVGGAPG
jgi:hypothetical protein